MPLTRLILLLFVGQDVLFGPLVIFAFVNLLRPAHVLEAVLMMAGLFLAKTVVTTLMIISALRPYESFAAEERMERKGRLVAAADAALQRFPWQFALVYAVGWLFVVGGGYALMQSRAEHFTLVAGSGVAVSFILPALFFGTMAVMFPVLVVVTTGHAGACSVVARDQGIELTRAPVRLQARIGLMALCLGLAPLFWMVAVGYISQMQAVNRALAAEGRQVLDATLAGAGSTFLLNAGIFAVLVAFWAPLSATVLARAISAPIQRLTNATREIVEEGNQTRMEVIPMTSRDEVGVLTERFNDLIDMMRELSRGADAIARGDLGVEINLRGELPDAFRRMTHSLNEVVRQIRQTSVDLAAAATEILAASQEQETAATSQSSAMTEISHTMDSLSESAAHVFDSVAGVLSNAEQTLVTTDSMVERIESLSTHTGRIAELLDIIRDIADRSDLLALNGSLEASRAGDGGHGFALVAAEMRRLAVRVTASVEDVKKLLADIREASAATIMATEEGRRLARATTEAARQITFVSQQQRSGTEQVSESVRGLSDVVTQAAAATSQTRTSAQGLKGQADQLATLVQRFEVAEEAG